MKRFLFSLAIVLFAAVNAQAAGTFTSLPDATVPLGSVPDFMPLDQGTGCPTAQTPCVTSKVPSLYVGQPIQAVCAAILSPFTYQQCLDTSTNPVTLKEYFGGKWWTLFTLSNSTGPAISSTVVYPFIPNGTVLGNSSGVQGPAIALSTLPSGLTIPGAALTTPTVTGPLAGASATFSGAVTAATLSAANIANRVPTNAALTATSTLTYPSGVWRDDFASGNGAPPLYYQPSTLACTLNAGAGDNGSQVQSSNGLCWLAQFPNRNEIDVREFGATTVASDNVTATDAIEAYVEASGGCAFYPNIGPFKVSVSTRAGLSGFGAGIVTDNGGCIKGEKASTVGTGGISTTASEIQVTGNVDGISAASGHRVNNVKISGITVTSLSAPSSTSANVTAGLHRGQGTGWQIDNLTLKDFVICRWFDQSFGASGQDTEIEPQCSQQTGYPNVKNGFPEMGTYIAGNTGQVQAHVVIGGQDYSNQLVQTFTAPNGTGGAYSYQVDFSGTAGRLLFDSYHLRAKVGGVEKAQGIDYVATDTTPGAPSATIYGTTDQTTLTAGSNAATMSNATGLPTSISAGSGPPWCNFNPVITVRGPGIPPGTCVTSITGTSITLNNSVVSTQPSGVQTVTYGEAYVAGQPGCNLNLAASPVTSLCGQKITLTFNSGHFPGNGVSVSVLWNDPWGVAAMNLASGSSDNNWYGYGYGGYEYGVVLNAGRTLVDVAYAQITDVLSFAYPNIAGSRILLPASDNATVRTAPGYPLPGALTTSQPFVLCYISDCDAKMGADYSVNGISLDQLQHPGYVSGRWYPPVYGGSTIGSGATPTAIDQIVCHGLVLQAPATIAALGVRSISIGTSTTAKLAVYSVDPGSHRPGLLLGNTAAITLAGGDETGPMVAPITEPAGPYWACSLWNWSGAPQIQQVITTSGAGSFSGLTGGPTLQGAISSSLVSGTAYSTTGLYAAGFPASLVGLTTDGGGVVVPEIGWQAQ